MKFLLIIDSIQAQGGTQTFCRNIKDILCSNGHDVEILTIIDEVESGLQLSTINLGLRNSFLILFWLHKIRKISKRFDKIIVLSGHTFQYIHFALDNYNTIYRESNDPYFRNKNLSLFMGIFVKALYEIFLMKNHKLIIQNVTAHKKILQKHKKLSNLYILPNPCFAPYCGSVKKFSKRRYVLISLSRDTWIKGNDRHEIIYKEINQKTVVLGEINTNKKIKKSNIDYVGRVEEVRSYLEDAKVLILLSRVEGFPNVVQEAIQAGCYVVVSHELSWVKESFDKFGEIIKVLPCDRIENISLKLINIIKEFDEAVPASIRKSIKESFSSVNYIGKISEMNV